MLEVKQQHQQQAAVNKQTYTVGDCVRVQLGPDSEPEIGRILTVEPAAAEGEQQHLSLARFLRPEQVLGGRQSFHGDKELIESDHVLLVPAAAVQGRVRVLGLDAFQALKRVGALDYFARLAFKVAQEEFVPQHMPVYCICELPYNPDKFMVQCSACLNWYHPECLQCSIRALGAQSKWECLDCVGPAADDEDHAADS